jgi:hypothetical protein
MRFPTDNFLTDWNTTAGYEYGDKTDYGYHEADDLNLNGGGNIDLGQPLYAVAEGEITSVHTHTGSPTFGKHLHLKFQADGKDYYAHYAHCNEIYVTEGQKVKQGDKIATVGNSGTTFAHCHFAIKNQPTGIDGLAKTTDDLKKWEPPIAFIKRHLNEVQMATITQKELDEIRNRRDELYNETITLNKRIEQVTQDLGKEQANSKTYLDQLNKITDEEKSTTEQLLACEHSRQPLQDAISSTKKAIGYDDTLLTDKLPEMAKKLYESKVKYLTPKGVKIGPFTIYLG